LGALVVPDFDALRERVPALAEVTGDTGRSHAADIDLDDASIRALFRHELESLVSRATGFKPFECVRRFQLLKEPFSTASGEMTETLKMRRHVVASKRGAALRALYDE